MFAQTLQHQRPSRRVWIIAAVVLGSIVPALVLFADWRTFVSATRLPSPRPSGVDPLPEPPSWGLAPLARPRRDGCCVCGRSWDR